MNVETHPARRQAPVTASYAHLRDERTQPSPAAPAPAPAVRSNPLALALAGFLILAAFLAIMGH